MGQSPILANGDGLGVAFADARADRPGNRGTAGTGAYRRYDFPGSGLSGVRKFPARRGRSRRDGLRLAMAGDAAVAGRAVSSFAGDSHSMSAMSDQHVLLRRPPAWRCSRASRDFVQGTRRGRERARAGRRSQRLSGRMGRRGAKRRPGSAGIARFSDSLAHIIDMHQLTKDPSAWLSARAEHTLVCRPRDLTAFEAIYGTPTTAQEMLSVNQQGRRAPCAGLR